MKAKLEVSPRIVRTTSSPLFVDLDNTLTKVDCLFESMGVLLSRSPFKIFKLILLLLQGRKTILKQWLTEQVTLDVANLPYSKEVLDLIEKKRAAGAKVYLATASNKVIADAVAKHLGCFDGVLASDAKVNLKGENKLATIKSEVKKLGASGFEYIGDTKADLPIFLESEQSYLVAKSKAFAKQACGECTQLKVIANDSNTLASYIKQLRPHQWAKNALLFVPLIMTRDLDQLSGVWNALIAMILFSFSASSVYCLNDWVDVNKDRKHPTKWKRPLASGEIPLLVAPVAFVILASLSLIGSLLLLDLTFMLILLVYLVMNILYSFALKTKAILDVIVLTMMYVIRVFAGGVATDVYVTNWLLSVCLFFFLSLAMAKRFTELLTAEKQGCPSDYRIRGYEISDLNVIKSFGIGSAIAAIAVVTMYIQNIELASNGEPRVLWLLCPLILYWLGRFWMITSRGDLTDDPIVFAIKDKVSYGIFACVICVLAAAEFPIAI